VNQNATVLQPSSFVLTWDRHKSSMKLLMELKHEVLKKNIAESEKKEGFEEY
jgi:hypothetical protein